MGRRQLEGGNMSDPTIDTNDFLLDITDVVGEATEPPTGSTHSTALRGESVATTRSPLFEGRFGRMFRSLPPFVPSRGSLTDLAALMFEGQAADVDNPRIPAGYTYLGQFVDHDITFDPASSLQRQNDPDGLVNFRTPRFDLDSLYGRGPSDDPFMYNQRPADQELKGSVFLIGRNVGNGRDLPRNDQDRALVGDPRNDENLIVSQLHCTLLRFHNKMVRHLAGTRDLRGTRLFRAAQRLTRWHYQWVVVNDFLRRIAGGQLVDELIPEGTTGDEIISRLQFFNWTEQPFIPVEFSVAAYRFGHSMIRFDYTINDVVPTVPIFSGSTDPLANLNGFRRLPDQWGFQWEFFFETQAGHAPQLSRLVDAKLARPLRTLPGVPAPRSLAERNLLRGRTFGLPSGQAVAAHMGVELLSDDDVGAVASSSEFAGNAPLWFYILREGAVVRQGRRLGPVGARIVGEVLAGLLAGDPLSYVNVRPGWRPQEPFARDGEFGMPELLRAAVS
jgi:hypothetical protein